MTTAPAKRWLSRIAGGLTTSVAAIIFVWGTQHTLHITHSQGLQLTLAGIVGGIVGVLGKMFLDEVARR